MTGPPRSAAVVGAGMVGLSTAWFLQERGVKSTVFDTVGPGAGASWGNAGWITPTLSTPLTDPSMLKYGLRQLLRPTSPLYIPPAVDPGLFAFLARMARNSTPSRWRSAVGNLIGINRRAISAFDSLIAGGVDSPLKEADEFVFGYADPAGPLAMVEAAQHLSALGQEVNLEIIPIAEARVRVPMLAETVLGALKMHDQRFVDPPAFVNALAESFVTRGGSLRNGVEVSKIADFGSRVQLSGATLDEQYDVVVIASGATVNELAHPFGVRTRIRPGRGYSFSVEVDQMPRAPVYFPSLSVVCTPLEERMRIAGMMEFRRHDSPLDRRRIAAIVESVRPMLRGVDLDNPMDEWVGSRPCTEDGLPLVGGTTSPRVFVAGGHAMEGMTLGPATGRLLAEQIVSGAPQHLLAGFDPLR